MRSEQPVLYCDGVSVCRGGTPVVDDITLQVPGGEPLGVIGPPGSGKSTLLWGLAGLLPLCKGCVYVAEPAVERAETPGVGSVLTLQTPVFPQDSSIQALVSVVNSAARQSSYWLLDGDGVLPEASAQLLEACRLRTALHKTPNRLSYGEKKIVGLALAFARNPLVLLVDEPFSGVDRRRIGFVAMALKAFSARGRVVVVVDHNWDALSKVVSSAIALGRGRLLRAGTFGDVVADARVIEAFGV